MENHGKWDTDASGASSPIEKSEELPLGSIELARYLAHLENTDQMLSALTGFLASRERPAVLCFYGDHMPSLPDVYYRLGYDDPRTDYFVWTNGNTTSPVALDVPVEVLGRLVLDSGLTLSSNRRAEVGTNGKFDAV